MFKKLILGTALAIGLTITPAVAQTSNANVMPEPVKSGYAPVNGVKVYYAVYGKGDPIVLLHGGFGMVEMFGPVLAELAKNHTVIGVDLQAHGRTLPFDRPMSYEAMATDVANLVGYLGYKNADVAGYSLGGGVALRMGIDHPDVVDKLILISTPFAFSGWHESNARGMKAMGSAVEQTSDGMKQTPMYQGYVRVAPKPDNWSTLIAQTAALIGQDYDWSREVATLKAPTMVVSGDWDSVRLSHTAKFFDLLGSGRQDANWDRSGMNQHRMAILPNTTHYDIFASPALANSIVTFVDAK